MIIITSEVLFIPSSALCSLKTLSCQSLVSHSVARTAVLLAAAFCLPLTHTNAQLHATQSQTPRTDLGKQKDNISVCTKVILPLTTHVPRDAVLFFFSSPSSRSALSNFIIFCWLPLCPWGMPKTTAAKTSPLSSPNSAGLSKQSVMSQIWSDFCF